MRPERRNLNNVTKNMVINLPSEVTVREIPAVTVKTSKIEILSVEDNPNQKKIVVHTKQLGKITLWESENYDMIGQWTDSDIERRLIELFLK